MATILDKNISPKFESIKDSDEEILWTEKPSFIPYLLSGLRFVFIGLVIIMLTIGVLFGFVFENYDDFIMILVFFGNSFLVRIFLIISAFLILKRFLLYFNIVYGFSQKRILIRSGFLGTDFKIIDYDKITDIEVNINVLERIFKVGTIKFFTGRTAAKNRLGFDKFESIKDPYNIFKKVKEISMDIKTDMEYPNAFRPEKNEGYKTKYRKE